MAKARRTRHITASQRVRARPYESPFSKPLAARNMVAEDCPKCLDKRDWENVICSVCMECPHNAVLLLCSSHDKGCRPYMCGTSFRYSNCLDQYKNASAKLKSSSSHRPVSKSELGNLRCPLCRGQVKGWTIVQPARDYLNLKRRVCMQENCVFAGTFKELRKHMKIDHPCARPREVDPDVEQNWRRLEIEDDRDDIISTVMSVMPGSMVFGDYVIERNNARGSESNEDDDGIDAGLGTNLVNVALLLHTFGASGNYTRRSDADTNNVSHVTINLETNEITNSRGAEEVVVEVERNSNSLASRMRRQGLFLLGRSDRRRRNREANQNSRPSPPAR